MPFLYALLKHDVQWILQTYILYIIRFCFEHETNYDQRRRALLRNYKKFTEVEEQFQAYRQHFTTMLFWYLVIFAFFASKISFQVI